MTDINPDVRLCRAYTACRSFQASYKAKTDTCSGCQGDLTRFFLVTRTVDKHTNPVISQVRSAQPDTAVRLFVEAVQGVRADLIAEGIDVELGEVGKLITIRLMQRISVLEATLKLRVLREVELDKQ